MDSNVVQKAKDEARHLADDAKREASRMAGQAGDMVQGLVNKQKDQAAERLGGVAGALRDVGNRLQEQDGTAGVARYATRAADQVDRLSKYLHDRGLNTFFRDTETFARRHPDVFLGGTFLAGLLLARFLKSSSADRSFDGYEGSAYASYPGERFGRGAEFGGPPEPHRSEDRPGPYGSPDGFRVPDTPEGA